MYVVYSFIVHVNWPQAYRAGKLAHVTGSLEQALSLFSEAQEVAQITHGTAHSLYKELQLDFQSCLAERAERR